MDINQFAVYQLKNISENRKIRFRPYSALQEKGIQIQYGDYEQVYLARMQLKDGPEQIRKIRKYPVGISRCSPAILWISRLLKTGRNIWRMGSIFEVPR